ncbi:MAG: hypothetical protein JW936_02755 [Sedimentisphaerales bacterium]|nr:hypothetical protein [Sedimentisphaerales bacterium]
MKTMLSLIAISLLLAGCSDHYTVSIDSINNGSFDPDQLCYIDSGMPGVTVDDLYFKEFSIYVQRALESIGYIVVDNLDDAEVLVLMDYKMSGPQQQSYTTDRPVYGQIGVAMGGGCCGGGRFYRPTYGIIGTVPVTHYYTTYEKHISLTAYDWLEKVNNDTDVMLWDTEIVNVGRSDDLREIFPIMIAAANPYIGTNTGQRVEVELEEDDDEVEFIKGISDGDD